MRRKMRWKLAVLALSCLLPVSGCWDAKEIEHMFYANALGIDKKENGEYEIYVQLLDFTTLGRSESGISVQPGTGAVVGKATGGAFNIALHKLYATAQRRIFWGHLSTIVLSERVLDGGYLDLLDQITRYHEFRYIHWIFGTRDSIEKLFSIVPILEYSPVYSQMNDPAEVYNQSSQIRPMRLYRFFREMNEPGLIPLLPSIGVGPPEWLEGGQQRDNLEMDGYFLIENRKLAGYMSKWDAIGLRWLDRSMKRTPLIVGNPEDPITPGPDELNPMAMMLFMPYKVDIIPVIEGEEVRFDLDLTMRARAVLLRDKVTDDEVIERAKKQMTVQIRHSFEKGLEMKSDPLKLMYALYRKNPAKFRQIQGEGEDFPLNERSLRNIHIKILMKFEGKTNRALEDQQ